MNNVCGKCREVEMWDLNELMNLRVVWFGIMFLFVCFGVVGW